MLGIFKKKINPLKELRKLLYIRISRFAGITHGYQEKSREIVALVNAHPSIINGLSHDALFEIKMAFDNEAEKFKLMKRQEDNKPQLIQEITDMVNNRGFLNKEGE